MADLRERVKSGLGDVRTLIIGAEILLGFQYSAFFKPGMAGLDGGMRSASAVAFALLLLTVVFLIAPAAFKVIAERGEVTSRQCGLTDAVIVLALIPFGAATGISAAVATSATLGPRGAGALGGGLALLALGAWFGFAGVPRRPRVALDRAMAHTPLKEKIQELSTEIRIVLPGLQALLGFQLAAYLTSAFARLPPAAKAVHTVSLVLLIASMVALIVPVPFHRLAESGEDSPRVHGVGVASLCVALATLAVALAGDVYVAMIIVAPRAAIPGAIVATVVALGVWFAFPSAARRPAPGD